MADRPIGRKELEELRFLARTPVEVAVDRRAECVGIVAQHGPENGQRRTSRRQVEPTCVLEIAVLPLVGLAQRRRRGRIIVQIQL